MGPSGVWQIRGGAHASLPCVAFVPCTSGLRFAESSALNRGGLVALVESRRSWVSTNRDPSVFLSARRIQIPHFAFPHALLLPWFSNHEPLLRLSHSYAFPYSSPHCFDPAFLRLDPPLCLHRCQSPHAPPYSYSRQSAARCPFDDRPLFAPRSAPHPVLVPSLTTPGLQGDAPRAQAREDVRRCRRAPRRRHRRRD